MPRLREINLNHNCDLSAEECYKKDLAKYSFSDYKVTLELIDQMQKAFVIKEIYKLERLENIDDLEIYINALLKKQAIKTLLNKKLIEFAKKRIRVLKRRCVVTQRKYTITEDAFKIACKEHKLTEDMLCKYNLGLVASIAGRYVGRGEFLDLVGFGNIGMLRGFYLFDTETGNRPSTYLSWWIRHAISRGIFNTLFKVAFIPIYLLDSGKNWLRIRSILESQFGELDVNIKIGELLRIVNTNRKPKEKILVSEKLQNKTVAELDDFVAPLMFNIASYDALFEQDSDNKYSFQNILFHESAHLFAEGFDLPNQEKKEIIEMIFAKSGLTSREREVIRSRLGFSDVGADSENPPKLQDIGNSYGLSRERIRQIQASALKKLKEGTFRLPQKKLKILLNAYSYNKK